MNNKYDEQSIIMQADIETNKQEMKANNQDSDGEIINLTEDFKEMLSAITYNINTLKLLPNKKESPNILDPTTLGPDNNRDQPLDSGQPKKIGGMFTLKHEISSPKFKKLFIKTELKRDTDMELNNLYNHIKMCIDAVTRLQKDLLPGYQSIKIHSEFAEYFVPDRDHSSYYCNVQVYNSLGHSLCKLLHGASGLQGCQHSFS